MGYYADYGGSIVCKDLPIAVYDDLRKYFGEIHYDSNRNEIEVSGYDKYYEDEIYEALEKVKPYTQSGCIEYDGEDSCYWRFIFKDGEWVEDNGVTIYESELPIAIYDKEEFLGRIIDVIQDCLDDPKGDTIEGEWYDNVKDELVSIMKNWKVFS